MFKLTLQVEDDACLAYGTRYRRVRTTDSVHGHFVGNASHSAADCSSSSRGAQTYTY